MKNLDVIEKYLRNGLTADERQEFEAQLKNDVQLKEEFDLVKALGPGIQSMERQKIEENVKNIHNNLKKENYFRNQTKIIDIEKSNNDQKKKGGNRFLYIAAALAFLLGATFFMNKSVTTTGDKDLMAAYFNENTQQVDDILADLVSFGMADTEKNKKDSLKVALESYKKGDFKTSQKVLSEYLDRYGEDNTARYFLGLNLMNTGEYGKAIKQFSMVEKDSNFDQMHWLNYNKALCFLKNGDDSSRASAKKILEKILNNPSFSNTDRQAIVSMIDFAK